MDLQVTNTERSYVGRHVLGLGRYPLAGMGKVSGLADGSGGAPRKAELEWGSFVCAKRSVQVSQDHGRGSV